MSMQAMKRASSMLNRGYIQVADEILRDAIVNEALNNKADNARELGLDYEPTVSGTESRVCADIAKRQQLGLAKYGTSVQDNPLSLREWLQHAYEETLDKAVYLRRAIEEIDKQ